MGIGALDQLDLPGTMPFLDGFLRGDGFVDAIKVLGIYQPLQTIVGAEL